MAMGALTAATDAVHDHFQKLAEASDRLIAAKMKEWEAIDNAFAAMGVEIKDARMKAASAAMTPEERRKKIDEL